MFLDSGSARISVEAEVLNNELGASHSIHTTGPAQSQSAA